jgi:two-component system phosphate regulon sensor histidine kinase PhoR
MKVSTKELPSPVISHIQHLERIRQDFVANVSHELRTPLTVIHGYIEALLDEKDGKHQKIFKQMYEQTLRMENLIEDLLLLSRLEDPEIENKADQWVDVSAMLGSIHEEAINISGESKHHIQLQTDKTLLLKGCKEELRSLFSNIIFNAIKYTPPQGDITINWYRKNKKSYFTVQDTGIGIEALHIPRLTERFYRVDPARSRSSGGTGLGLAIAKHVLIRHEGQLKISSEYGKGSLFACIFPMSRTLQQ